jgi:hypothetical protein
MSYDYGRPLKEFGVDWLASEVAMLHVQLDTMARDRREAAERDARTNAGVARLVAIACASGAGQSAKHDRTCWKRHVHCLAHILHYRPEEAGERANDAA